MTILYAKAKLRPVREAMFVNQHVATHLTLRLLGERAVREVGTRKMAKLPISRPTFHDYIQSGFGFSGHDKQRLPIVCIRRDLFRLGNLVGQQIQYLSRATEIVVCLLGMNKRDT